MLSVACGKRPGGVGGEVENILKSYHGGRLSFNEIKLPFQIGVANARLLKSFVKVTESF